MNLKRLLFNFIILFLVFMFGFFVGRINEPPLLPSYNVSFPTVYTPNSDVSHFDGYTGEQLNSALKGTKLEGLGFWFSYCAWQNNISSLYLTAHAIHESAWGTSYIARRKHNLFGFGAFDHSPYWSANYYSSYKECIQQVSSFIAKNYLTKEGAWYEGTTLKAMNTHYASDSKWSDKIASIMNMLYYKIGKPDKIEAVAENEYYQNFNNKDYNLAKTFNKKVSKGQFIRDLYAITPTRDYGSAGEWAISVGLINPTEKWWINKITRHQIIQIVNKYYSLYYQYKIPPKFMDGNFYEQYNKWYCLLLLKLKGGLYDWH